MSYTRQVIYKTGHIQDKSLQDRSYTRQITYITNDIQDRSDTTQVTYKTTHIRDLQDMSYSSQVIYKTSHRQDKSYTRTVICKTRQVIYKIGHMQANTTQVTYEYNTSVCQHLSTPPLHRLGLIFKKMLNELVLLNNCVTMSANGVCQNWSPAGAALESAQRMQ